MGPGGVVVRSIPVEAFLLRRPVSSRWTSRSSLERLVKPFASSVLRRLAGIDALNTDPEPDPIGHHSRESSWCSGIDEGAAVVAAHRFRQSVLPKNAPQISVCLLESGPALSANRKVVTREN